MRLGSKFAAALLAMAVLVSASAAQSLGEVARRERAKKQARPPPIGRIITEEDLLDLLAAESSGKTGSGALAESAKPAEVKATGKTKDEKPAAAELQAKIKAQKQKVRDLQAKIGELQKQLNKRNSIGTVTVGQQVIAQPGGIGSSPSPGLCATSNAMHTNPYKEWCEEPAKLTAELEKSQAKLKEEQAALAALQEEARRQGYGNAFYDPD